MRYRQVNLDYHTGEKIPDIGSAFSKEQFQEALKLGHVDSVTLFAKCHHGWSYYPSKVNPMHPNLKFDLLGAQVEAAREIGVATPLYCSVGFDEKTAVEHPEWCWYSRKDYDAGIENQMLSEEARYHLLCFNTPYIDTVVEQVKEILTMYPADGIFLDIARVRACYCPNCIKTMRSRGMDPDNLKDVMELAEEVYDNYTNRIYQAVQEVRPGIGIFHNGGHIAHGRRDLAHKDVHLELESLPTGGWGYDHFPISASYARTLGMDYLGMTGKFHMSWGEFGGFKHPNALRYETALDLANGAACSIGDQLHPNGKMEKATYELIGKAYQEVEEKEPWVKGYHNLADIAVLGAEAIENYYACKGERVKTFDEPFPDADSGCSRILLEGHYLFNFVDTEEDFEKYKLLILPDQIKLDEMLEKKIKDFTAHGGKILATGLSGTRSTDQSFALDFGCEFLGENPYRPDYFRPEFELKSLSNSAFVMFSQGYCVKAADGTRLGLRENPYFNRTKEHFCSHAHTPNNPKDTEEAYMEGKDGIYIGWNVFEDYAVKGSIVYKEMVLYAIDRLLKEKTVETDLPAQGVLTVTDNGQEKVVHHLYAAPVKRGRNVEIIEDLLPVYHTHTKVRVEKCPEKVYLAPQKQEIPFTYEDGQVCFEIEKFVNHQMVVIH